MQKENQITSILARPSVNHNGLCKHTWWYFLIPSWFLKYQGVGTPQKFISSCDASNTVSLGSLRHPTLTTCENALKSPVFIFLRHFPLDRCNHCYLSFPGPTVLEVFNTLLKHLRISVDFELSDKHSSAESVTLSTSSKENDERIVQNAIIQTIGE